MSTAYLYMNAWHEMIARLFSDTEVQRNISPEWLVNPATNRRLKLDYLFPEVDVAIRFSGLTAKGQGRRSDWEILEDKQRDQTRLAVCRLNGVQLAVVDPFGSPVKQMDGFLRVLSRASRTLAQSEMDKQSKQRGMDLLGKAHQGATRLRTRLSKDAEQTITTLAEGWRDREMRLSATLQESSYADDAKEFDEECDVANLSSGQRVVHSHYGDGVVTEIRGKGSEAQITILFDADQERTFLARLVTDKLKTS